jgi:hypothetical protein
MMSTATIASVLIHSYQVTTITIFGDFESGFVIALSAT